MFADMRRLQSITIETNELWGGQLQGLGQLRRLTSTRDEQRESGRGINPIPKPSPTRFPRVHHVERELDNTAWRAPRGVAGGDPQAAKLPRAPTALALLDGFDDPLTDRRRIHPGSAGFQQSWELLESSGGS